MTPDLIVLYEHPEWQKPLFAALERRGVRFEPFDLKSAAFSNVEAPAAPLYFNQASPSAYVRGHVRAVPLALAYMRSLERRGVRVLNGADVFALELSKSAQATLLHTLGIDTRYIRPIHTEHLCQQSRVGFPIDPNAHLSAASQISDH